MKPRDVAILFIIFVFTLFYLSLHFSVMTGLYRIALTLMN